MGREAGDTCGRFLHVSFPFRFGKPLPVSRSQNKGGFAAGDGALAEQQLARLAWMGTKGVNTGRSGFRQGIFSQQFPRPPLGIQQNKQSPRPFFSAAGHLPGNFQCGGGLKGGAVGRVGSRRQMGGESYGGAFPKAG